MKNLILPAPASLIFWAAYVYAYGFAALMKAWGLLVFFALVVSLIICFINRKEILKSINEKSKL